LQLHAVGMLQGPILPVLNDKTQIIVLHKILSHVWDGTRDEMTGSSSDDWIYLTLWLQFSLITFRYRQYSAIADLQTLHN
jgi:hypothetical protein